MHGGIPKNERTPSMAKKHTHHISLQGKQIVYDHTISQAIKHPAILCSYYDDVCKLGPLAKLQRKFDNHWYDNNHISGYIDPYKSYQIISFVKDKTAKTPYLVKETCTENVICYRKKKDLIRILNYLMQASPKTRYHIVQYKNHQKLHIKD